VICFTQSGKMAIRLVRVGKPRDRIVSSATHLPPALGGLPKAPGRPGMFVPNVRGGDAAYHGALLSATEVSQDGKGEEAIEPRAKAGPGASRRQTRLRGALRGEENWEVGRCGERRWGTAANVWSAGSDVGKVVPTVCRPDLSPSGFGTDAR
jgi:hypothetical protein